MTRNLKQSIVKSLDGSQIGLFPYLPYILQDLRELGADPSVMLSLIKNNIENKKLRILDLGCGKGAVSINIAREIDCTVRGIDAMPEFIEAARNYSEQSKLSDKCEFEEGDIRIRINELRGFDVIISGAIGPVLGDLQTTLKILTGSLNSPGYVLLDDGYIPDESKTDYDRCLRKTDFYRQINCAGFEIIREIIFGKEEVRETDKTIYDLIKKRIEELILKYPEKKELFDGYLESQEYENYMLANEIITGTWLLKIILHP